MTFEKNIARASFGLIFRFFFSFVNLGSLSLHPALEWCPAREFKSYSNPSLRLLASHKKNYSSPSSILLIDNEFYDQVSDKRLQAAPERRTRRRETDRICHLSQFESAQRQGLDDAGCRSHACHAFGSAPERGPNQRVQSQDAAEEALPLLRVYLAQRPPLRRVQGESASQAISHVLDAKRLRQHSIWLQAAGDEVMTIVACTRLRRARLNVYYILRKLCCFCFCYCLLAQNYSSSKYLY